MFYLPILSLPVIYCMWENFGGGKFWRINGSKVFGKEKFGESVGSLFLAFINIGGENFGELPTVRQIRQNFPPPKFSHVRYSIGAYFDNVVCELSTLSCCYNKTW